jgi:hypothetical protein
MNKNELIYLFKEEFIRATLIISSKNKDNIEKKKSYIIPARRDNNNFTKIYVIPQRRKKSFHK